MAACRLGQFRRRPHPPRLRDEHHGSALRQTTARYHRDPLPTRRGLFRVSPSNNHQSPTGQNRSEEHTSELQSHSDLVCRLLLEKKKTNNTPTLITYAHPVRLEPVADRM